MNRSSGIGRSTAVMAFGTLLSRLTGAVRTIVFAWFGTTALADAYLQSNTTPNMVYELVAGGVLSATLVPLFVELLLRDDDDAHHGIDAIVSLVAAVMVGAVVLVALAAPALMWIPFHEPGKQLQRQVGSELLRMFAPQIAIYGFVTVATAALNARRRFAAPMLAPVCNNLVVIVVLLWARRVVHALVPHPSGNLATLQAVANDTTAKLLLGFGTTAGVVAMGLALLPSMRGLDIGLRWRWDPRHPAVRELARLSGWTLGYVAANIAALQFVQYALGFGPNGDLAAYNLAYTTFFVLPHGIFAVSIMTAIQPDLAEAFLERRRGRFRTTLSTGIRNVLAVMVPAAAGYVVLSGPIVSLIRSGQLSNDGARLIGDVLRAFSIGLPGYSVYLLLMNAYKAMRDTKSTFTINVIENSINIVLGALLYRLGFGVQGLAFAFAVSYLASAVFAGKALGLRTRGIHGPEILESLRRILVASAAMALAVWLTARGVGALVVGDGAAIGLPDRLARLVQVGAAVGVGVSVYGVVAPRIGVSEIDAVVSGVRRRLGGRASRR